MELKALSLFSGIGGLDLAAEMAGIETVALCEIEPFPVEVLTKRFPGVPIFEDVRKLTAEVIRDRTGMDASQSIDVVFGGFPCQDLSQAGKQVGLTGARSGLWFEMLRVIHEIRPRYVVAENVRGAVNLALDTVYSNLVGEGYKVYPYVIPASAVGAPHQRERLFVVGVREDVHRQYTEAMENPGCELRQGSGECRKVEREAREGVASDSEFSSGTLCPTPRANKVIVTNEQSINRINKTGYHGNLEEAIALCPTPTSTERSGVNPNTGSGAGLSKTVRLWPTPCSRGDNGGGPVGLGGGTRAKKKLDEHVGRDARKKLCSGSLNSAWVEQLMNFPEGWTDLDVDEPKPWQGWPALLGQEQYLYEFPRTTTGCKNRAKQLKAYGNSVVPAQAYPFFKAIAEIERIVKEDNK